jgi:integrase
MGTRDQNEAQRKYDQFMTNKGIIESSKKYRKLKIRELYKKFETLYIKAGKDAKTELYPLRYLQIYLNDSLCDSISKYNVEMFKLHRLQSKKQIYNTKIKRNIDTEKTISSTSVNIELRKLRSLFNKAVRLNLIMSNPFTNVELPQSVKHKKTIISESDLFHIITEVSNQKVWNLGQKKHEIFENTNMKHVILFAYLTGCRVSEIVNLQWEDVDFAKRIIHIVNKFDKATNTLLFKIKTNEPRDIPINDALLDILTKQYGTTGKYKYVFGYLYNGTERRYSRDRVSKYFKRICRKCGIDESINFHCLRHTFISNLVSKNVNLFKIKELAGHKNIITTQGYTHIDVENLRDAMDVLSIPKY